MITETVTTKERPILFSTQMVIAVLEDMKDITRRTRGLEEINTFIDDWEFIRIEIATETGKNSYAIYALFRSKLDESTVWVRCPYGKPGDILWVRETWALLDYLDKNSHVYKADGFIERYGGWERDTRDGIERIEVWKPSIHMPKSACRLKLEILSIGVERLQDITEEDAVKEGIEVRYDLKYADRNDMTGYRDYGPPHKDGEPYWFGSARDSFQSLWYEINGAESWDANPWVWKINFKKL